MLRKSINLGTFCMGCRLSGPATGWGLPTTGCSVVSPRRVVGLFLLLVCEAGSGALEMQLKQPSNDLLSVRTVCWG
jgi:hypothetical protein